MARELDTVGNSATSKSMCARALMELMDRIDDLAPVEIEDDSLDDLARRRSERRAGVAAAQA